MKLDVIYNEDCYSAIRNIPDKSIDLVYIDIPYDISYSGGGCLQKNVKHAVKDMNKNKETLLKGIDYKILDDLCRVMKRIYIYIWCSKSQIYDLMKYFIEKKKCNFNILCWCKDNPVPFGNSPFLSDIEYCLVFYESGAIFNQGCENKHKWYLSSINQKDKKLFNHPTIKPLDFVKMNLLNSTKENDVVLDCFMGSGTTAVACKQLNRHYIGFELNPEYYQIAIDRVNGLTVADRKKKELGQLSLFDIE
jgi:DNA modification methylase